LSRLNKGFTLIEILLILSIMTIIFSIVIPINIGLYDRLLLKATAKEIKSSLHMAQQLSLDESRNYCVELFSSNFRVREQVVGGKIVYRQKIDDRIKVLTGYDHRITYNRDGNTAYGCFALENRQKDKIMIEVMIGTGRVRISSLD